MVELFRSLVPAAAIGALVRHVVPGVEDRLALRSAARVVLSQLADADQRLGPILEAIIDGRYFWVPFTRLAAIEIEAPADLRDTVWTAASFVFSNGAQSVGLIPTRYAGTVEEGDDALMLARRTEWRGARGLGQRMFVTDAGEHPLLDTRSIVFLGGEEAGNG